MKYNDSDDSNSNVFRDLLRIFCGIGVALFIFLLGLGLWNVIRLFKHKSNGTQALIILYYVFMMLAMCSSCFVDVWRLVDPNLVIDADDPHELPLI